MTRMNYIVKINELIKEFDQIDHENIPDLMAWIYKTLNYKLMYENPSIETFIAKKLKSKGYPSASNRKETELSFFKMLKKDSEFTPEEIATKILSMYIHDLEVNDSVDEALSTYIKHYNENYNQERIIADMMKMLKENNGTRVVYVKYRDGELITLNGTINGVEEYQSVTINGERIPFIGNNIGIKTIFSTDGKYLYNNNLLTKESNLENFESITELNVKTFGENYEKAQQKVF